MWQLFQRANGFWLWFKYMMASANVSDLLHPPTHQAGKDCHHHFGLDFHEVLGESVDTRPDLPRHRDCVPGDQVQPHQAVSAGRKVNVVLCGSKPPPPKKNKTKQKTTTTKSYLAFSNLSSPDRLPVLTMSKLMLWGWMASISSRTAKLLLISLSWTTNK